MVKRVYKTVIDNNNRIVIPKKIRDYLGLSPSCQMNVEYSKGKIIVTRPNYNIANENKKFQKVIEKKIGLGIVIV
jgi:AbrB family looped-hinge helix DNA binding protein